MLKARAQYSIFYGEAGVEGSAYGKTAKEKKVLAKIP